MGFRGRGFKSRRPDQAQVKGRHALAVSAFSRVAAPPLCMCYERRRKGHQAVTGSASRILFGVVTTLKIVLLSGSV
jgi:hypothetical protein